MIRLIITIIGISFFLNTSAEKYIIIDKPTYKLHLINGNDTLSTYPVCLGKNFGQKVKDGDHKTPEGEFSISMIQNSTDWPYDFHDGKGEQKGVYGPWFFRLKTPMTNHIGIHGTSFPWTMGKRKSSGCIRMKNEDIRKLREHVFLGMKVIITPDIKKINKKASNNP